MPKTVKIAPLKADSNSFGKWLVEFVKSDEFITDKGKWIISSNPTLVGPGDATLVFPIHGKWVAKDIDTSAIAINETEIMRITFWQVDENSTEGEGYCPLDSSDALIQYFDNVIRQINEKWMKTGRVPTDLTRLLEEYTVALERVCLREDFGLRSDWIQDDNPKIIRRFIAESRTQPVVELKFENPWGQPVTEKKVLPTVRLDISLLICDLNQPIHILRMRLPLLSSYTDDERAEYERWQDRLTAAIQEEVLLVKRRLAKEQVESMAAQEIQKESRVRQTIPTEPWQRLEMRRQISMIATRFDLRYLFLGLVLVAIAVLSSIIVYPEWTQSNQTTLALFVAVILFVPSFIANFRKAFETSPQPIPQDSSSEGGFDYRSERTATIYKTTQDVNKISPSKTSTARDSAPSSYTCFIAHSYEDEAFSAKLYTGLKSHAIKVWRFAEDARWGASVWEEIEKNIKANDKLIVVCSENSLQSGPVNREIERALNREDKEHKNILFPIRIDDYIFAKDEQGNDKWQHRRKADVQEKVVGDFSGWERDAAKYERAFERLLKGLQAESTKA